MKKINMFERIKHSSLLCECTSEKNHFSIVLSFIRRSKHTCHLQNTLAYFAGASERVKKVLISDDWNEKLNEFLSIALYPVKPKILFLQSSSTNVVATARHLF
jgi:hypothetical protein